MRYNLFLLVLLTILFISSSQTYEEQSIIGLLQEWLPNRPLENWLATVHIPYYNHVISIEERGYYLFLEFCVRKSAHFILFGLVSLGFYKVLGIFRWTWLVRAVLAVLFTFICAILDEYHQSLTGGRTPTWQDVYLDTSGAICFIATMLLWHWRHLSQTRRSITKYPH